jgi:hypothetical protein
MYALTQQQIQTYEKLAKERHLVWIH